jgi:hypothetical protein
VTRRFVEGCPKTGGEPAHADADEPEDVGSAQLWRTSSLILVYPIPWEFDNYGKP